MTLTQKFKAWLQPEFRPDAADASWDRPYEKLRKRWVEIPTNTSASGRVKTSSLVTLSDEALLAEWEKSRDQTSSGPAFGVRGWYHTLYADTVRGKKLMDVGSGFGISSIVFAQCGASLTFVDLAATNLEVLKRLCRIMGLKNVRFQLLTDVASLQGLDPDFDIIMAIGSLHHAPTEINKPEYDELVRHLKIGGRWLQLAYPTVRWIRDGKPSFSKWGELTDGAGTPWAEPYDVPKLLSILAPAKFDVVLYHEFHNGDFNWFDLLYRGIGAKRP